MTFKSEGVSCQYLVHAVTESESVVPPVFSRVGFLYRLVTSVHCAYLTVLYLTDTFVKTSDH